MLIEQRLAVGLVGVQGNAHLIKRCRGIARQQCVSLSDAGTVGGNGDVIPFFLRDTEQILKLRMQQRLTHNVKIQIIRIGTQLFCQRLKLLRRHAVGRTKISRTKIAL